MTTTPAASETGTRTRRTCGGAGWLGLAATPTFALMAWIAANDAPGMALCASAASILPVDGMTAMYLLMSLFHLPPWLELASGRMRARTPPTTGNLPATEGDRR